jgi:hypothetical protein
MLLKVILVWLALQIPLGALIGTLIQNGMTRRRQAARPIGAARWRRAIA